MAEPTPTERRAQAAIARRLAEVGFALPGTLIERHMSCGKPTCRCAEEPPRLHGPYRQWTRKVDGKTLTINLTDEQIARYGAWFTNAQTFRSLLGELEDLSLRVVRRTEGWT